MAKAHEEKSTVCFSVYCILRCGNIYGGNLQRRTRHIKGEPRTPGYWKNHPEAWQMQTVTIGGVEYSQAEAIDLLGSNAKDATYKLASHLIAAELNAASAFYGTYNPNTVWSYINQANAFLTEHPLGSNPQGADRNYALALKDWLDTFNNS